VLRRGRSATQVSVRVRNAGADEGATTIAVFGAPRRGPSFVDVDPPEAPDPTQSLSYRDPPPPGFPVIDYGRFWRQVEGRAAVGHAPWQRFEPTTSDVATWLRFDEPPRLGDGQLDPLALVALADRMPGAVAERTAFAGPRWFAPSADLTVHILAPLHSEWVLAHDRARWADDGWASLETTMWDEGRQLVAYATQMVFFTYLQS
jgi:acyl-CoA thioesterase